MNIHTSQICIAYTKQLQKKFHQASVVSAIAAALFWAGGSTAEASERWKLFDNAPVSVEVGKGAKLVVYRKSAEGSASAADASPANIYIDGNYAASLLTAASTEVVLCAGRHRISATPNTPADALRDKSADGVNESLAAGSVKYFQVQLGGDSKIRLLPVMPEQATRDLAGMRRQVHTIPRIKPAACL